MTAAATVEQEVRTAYADAGDQREDGAFSNDMRCLNFLASAYVTPDQAASIVAHIGPYNAFDPDTVGDMLAAVAEADADALVAIGRESSPVLYVETDDPEAVLAVFGPRRYEDADDPMFETGRPDELGTVEPGAVGLTRKDDYDADDEDKIDPHMSCRHEAPPVPVARFAEPDPERDHIRAWWD